MKNECQIMQDNLYLKILICALAVFDITFGGFKDNIPLLATGFILYFGMIFICDRDRK